MQPTLRLTWAVRIRHAGTDEETLILIGGGGRPPGTVVDLEELGQWPADAPRLLRIRHRPSDGAVLRLAVSPDAVPGAPPLWYVEVGEPDADPPATNLVAFEQTPALPGPEGRVVTADELAERGVASADQVAALRWHPDSGLVHQVYVAPDHRRRRIATKLMYAAGGLGALRGWPLLEGGGHRTDLGDAWLKRAPDLWASRVRPMTEYAPPMTPGEQ